jgi:hypothetical protein
VSILALFLCPHGRSAALHVLGVGNWFEVVWADTFAIAAKVV